MSDRTHSEPMSVTELCLADDDVPLVVDVDGTLIRTDLLAESTLRLLARNPLGALRLPVWLAAGRAGFKARIADCVVPEPHTLPLNEAVLNLIRTERQRGRPVFLASASDRRAVQALADHLDLFDGVFASDGKVNLSGDAKGQALCQAFGAGGFDYMGNARVDLEVWRHARRVVVVNAPASLAEEARRRFPEVVELAPQPGPARQVLTVLRAMRVHQWLKNVLVFLPALAHHSLDGDVLTASALAFLAFCLCASSVYLLNDLIDLPSDRAHPTKRARPFASGSLPPVLGALLAPVLLALAGLVCLTLPLSFFAVLAAYYATTLLYTFVLKRRIVIDVVALAALYTVRVVAGGEATAIEVSEWLLAFSMFLFLCLALIKRYSELVERTRSRAGRPAGRGYVVEDAPIVGALAGASGFVSVLVLALYINSPDVHALYGHPGLLWGVGVLLLYWVARVVMLAHRGELHDDPLVFAATDRGSLVTVALMGAIVVAGSLP